MSEEEINKMCCDIYEGEDWQPMKDYIKSLQTQLQQKENIIKEVREYIENNVQLYDDETADYQVVDSCAIKSILDKEGVN